jgi:tRNA A-37 threonylcarbamoyl transferase component Bud32
MTVSDSTAFYQHALQQCLLVQTSLMQNHTLENGEKVWVRQAGARNSAWRYHLLKIAQQISGIHMLQPVPNLGGIPSLQTEAARLHALSTAGVQVPVILAQQPNALMISHIGEHNLENEWKQHKHQPEILLQRWQLGLNAIADVHKRKQYLSETFARNMIYVNQHSIGFIDFEDDPLSVMPLPHCHARDWLCYLHSGARLMQEYSVANQAKALWESMLHHQPHEVHTIVINSLRKIRWMRYFTARIYGKDTLKLAAMASYA